MRIEVGQIIKTNYGTGPFRIEKIFRGCTCSHVLDEIECQERPLPPHLHMTLRYLTKDHNEGKEAYINYIDEATLGSFGPGGKYNGDKITLLPNDHAVQTTLAFA